MREKEYQLSNETALLDLAAKLAPALLKLNSVFLSGDLGVGKTTFVRGFLTAAGYKGKVKSPTYTLVEDYVINGKAVFHFDWYRIEGSEALEAIGIREYFSQNALCLIEWPEHGQDLEVVPDWRLIFEYRPEGRLVKVCAVSALGEQELEMLL